MDGADVTDVVPPNTAMTPAQLFESRVFRIPDYQRGYAWEDRQWDEFLEDLELLPTGSVHYTGTIVLNPATIGPQVKDRRGKLYQAYDVVDGQQRLTTVVLLLDAIRRKMVTPVQTELAEGICDTYLYVTDRNGTPLPKLTLNSDSHDYFFTHILSDKPSLDGPRIRSHRNLLGAKTHFTSYLDQKRKALGEGFPKWLEELRDRICDQLALSTYHVQRVADAGVIFEVMNNRGKPITELEKAKNYLLYLAGKLHLPDKHNLDDQINHTWAHIFEQLMANGLSDVTNEDQLLRTHWLMAYDYQEKHWNGSKSIKARFHLRDYVGRHDELLADLTEYVRSLRNAATAYCDVANPRHQDAFKDFRNDETMRQRVVRQASKLSRLHIVAPFLPLLMAIRIRNEGNPQPYLVALDLCEKFAFRVYRLLGWRPTAGRSSLFLLANALYTAETTIPDAMKILIGLILKYSPVADVERAYEIGDEGNWYKWRGLTYFLYEYETHLAAERNKNVAINWSDLDRDDAKQHTIEHVLPQNPQNGYWTERFDAAARKKYTHDLGNLCLTLDNSSYGRKSFPDKRGSAGSGTRCYANGDLVMERDLAAYEDWDADTILDRRGKIVRWAIERWGVPIVKAQVPDSNEDDRDEDTEMDITVED